MVLFYQVIGRYVKALDAWEGCFRDVATDPNFCGQPRDPVGLRMHQQEFVEARNEINRMIRRATETTEQRGHQAPYGLLLDVTLRPPTNAFLPPDSALSERGRMLIHDVIMQTIADIDNGYMPKVNALVLPKERRPFAKLREHMSQHLPGYIVAIIAALGAIIAAFVRGSFGDRPPTP